MRRVNVLLLSLALVSCATTRTGQPANVNVQALDDVGGASQASVSRVRGQEVRVDVANKVGDCVLHDFLVSPSEKSVTFRNVGQIKWPGEFQRAKAVLHLWPFEDTTVMARYVHTVLVDSGSGRQPENGRSAIGWGEMKVGHPLANGFRFDHYEFVTEKTGHGGASASVKGASRHGSDQAAMLIRWYVDTYSSVQFSWKLFATGPCGALP